MSHRKTHSQGSIPFAWEQKPGLSRITAHQDCPISLYKGLHALNLESSTILPPQPSIQAPSDSEISRNLPANDEIKIPPPPCPSQPSRRSISSKGIIGWWQQDPFLVAYMECTKSDSRSTSKLTKGESKRSNGVGSKTKPKKKSKFIFSCKSSCEIRDDNFVRLANLPPLPKERIRTFR